MTRIDFYRNVDDKLRFACRLTAKVCAKPAKLIVWSPDAKRLSEFDRNLWAWQPTSFVPHCRVDSPLAAETPVLLATNGEALPHHEVLLNLADEWPPFFASFDRLLEIVSNDEADKERARERWSFYKKRGSDLQINDMEG